MAQRLYAGQNSNDFSEWTTEDTTGSLRFQLAAGAALGGTAHGVSVAGSGGTHEKVTANIALAAPRGTHRLACRVNKNTLVLNTGLAHIILELSANGASEDERLRLLFIEDGML